MGGGEGGYHVRSTMNGTKRFLKGITSNRAFSLTPHDEHENGIFFVIIWAFVSHSVYNNSLPFFYFLHLHMHTWIVSLILFLFFCKSGQYWGKYWPLNFIGRDSEMVKGGRFNRRFSFVWAWYNKMYSQTRAIRKKRKCRKKKLRSWKWTFWLLVLVTCSQDTAALQSKLLSPSAESPRSSRGACGRGQVPPRPCHVAVKRIASKGSFRFWQKQEARKDKWLDAVFNSAQIFQCNLRMDDYGVLIHGWELYTFLIHGHDSYVHVHVQ